MHLGDLQDLLLAHNPWWADADARPDKAREVSRDMLDVLLDYVGERGDRRAALMAGPRQVGKTVLLHQIADRLLREHWPPANITYFDFSDARIPDAINIGDVLRFSPPGVSPQRPRVFLLDEISKSSKWDRWLKQAVDAESGDRFIVTDSAVSLLREGTLESGQGRWDRLRIEGLSFVEFLRLLGPNESSLDVFRRVPNAIDRYLAIGGFPEHVPSSNFSLIRERIRDDVADKAIRRDLIRLGLDVERVHDLFVYLVQDSGAIFSARKRARDMGADERSVRHWIRSLEDAHLVELLPRHTGNAAARLRSQPKLYASDHGFISAFTPIPKPNTDSGIRGRVLEAAVFRHLRDVRARLEQSHLSFFRDNGDLESDFVLEYPEGRLVVEVTASSDPPPRKFERLRSVGEMLSASKVVLLQGGLVRADGNEMSVSLPDFLLNPPMILGRKR
jgi:predicted AAA+ superfamily ATPase